MEILHRGRDFDTAVVTISDVNRPALQLVGFTTTSMTSACKYWAAARCATWTA